MEYKEKAEEEERKREEKETYLLAVVRNAKKKQNSFGTAGCCLKQIGEAIVLFCNLKARF